ncbi:hypothetical protein HW555_004440 [Spodoptera exigua]|uniref:Uncharacterized protein n=1 Tax=Spodoptera exigua TaxID=7107 RepID=A0A835GIF9_SPOEX|nr:hypothetical protein HW555_004440 [Spodoptera exigua]
MGLTISSVFTKLFGKKQMRILMDLLLQLDWMPLLKEDELRDAVILVFANKQDMPNAMTAAELTNALNLNNLRNRRSCSD